MEILGVEFVRSAVQSADLPRDPVPQLAMVGRSNVGKSSLINALTGRKVARTSAAPGKTRLLNFYLVRIQGGPVSRFYVVDLPGYGYARGGTAARQGFDRLVAEYFAHGSCKHVKHGDPAGPSAVLLVVDARHPGLDADRAALAWLEDQGRPVVVAASKVDKLTRAERRHAHREWNNLHVPVMPVSATTGEGLEQLWARINSLLSQPR